MASGSGLVSFASVYNILTQLLLFSRTSVILVPFEMQELILSLTSFQFNALFAQALVFYSLSSSFDHEVPA